MSEDNTIPNPHDRFFKEMFSSRDIARSFLIHYLPEDVSRLLDPDSVRLSKDSYVDSRLRFQFSDLLYNVTLTTGDAAGVYILFEHKSQPDPFISWYLLSCMARIWRQDMKMKKYKKPRAIIPVVVYHGEEKWNIGLNFQDLFTVPPEMKRFVPDFEYRLCNFQSYGNTPIEGTPQLRIALSLMKIIFRPDIRAVLPGVFELIREAAQDQMGLEFLEAVLTYISSATDAADQVDEAYLTRLVEGVTIQTGGDIMPTLIEKWMEKGTQNMARESVAELVEIRFGNRPPQVLTRLNQLTDVPTLKLLHRQAATAQSLGEFEQFLETRVRMMQ